MITLDFTFLFDTYNYIINNKILFEAICAALILMGIPIVIRLSIVIAKIFMKYTAMILGIDPNKKDSYGEYEGEFVHICVAVTAVVATIAFLLRRIRHI